MARKRYPKITPEVIKVTVTNGQASIKLPKKTSIQLNLIGEEGELGRETHLIVTTHGRRVGLYPVRLPEVDPEE